MQLSFTVDVNEYDDVRDLYDEILDKAAEKFLRQVFDDWGNKRNDTLYDLLQEKAMNLLEINMNTDFKTAVANKVTNRLVNKFEKTKQYKSLVEGKEVESDSVIKTGLKDLVTEIVKSEMKNMFTK